VRGDGRGLVPRADVARAVLVPFVLARVLVGGALAISRHLVEQLHVSPVPIQIDQGLMAWDAAFYRDIAASGYDGVAAEGLRFFPLVALLGRVVALLPGVDAELGVLLIANLSALAFGFVFYALAWRERGDEAFARRAVWLAYLVPPAFVLVMGYAEATVMLLAALTLLALRSRRWWLAAVTGYLAGLARPVGVLLAVPALVEVIQHRRTMTRAELGGRITAVVAPFAGLFTYLAWASDRGDGFLYPLRVQEDPERRGSWKFPVTNVIDAARDAGADRVSAGVHVVAAMLLIVLLVVLIRRWPASYSCYAGAVLVLALSASNLDSLERYGLSTLPFLLAGADVTDAPDAERVVLVLAAAGLVVAAVLAFTGILVP